MIAMNGCHDCGRPLWDALTNGMICADCADQRRERKLARGSKAKTKSKTKSASKAKSASKKEDKE